MRAAWIGYHIEGRMALEALLDRGYRFEAVLTLTSEAMAKRSGAFDYSDLCRSFRIPLHRIDNINSSESFELLRGLSLDVAFVIGWSQIVQPHILETTRLGMIGAHASLLPHNRGSAPINWAIIKGESFTGNSLIWLSENVDRGDVIDQVRFEITDYDTCGSLYHKVAESNRDMILRVFPKLLAGERSGEPQPESNEEILPRRRPKDGLIDWSLSSRRVYDFVRALVRPYPGAFSWLDGGRWFIWHCALLPEWLEVSDDTCPGQILGPVVSPIAGACGQMVACGSGALVLLEIEGPDGEVLKGRNLSEKPWKGMVWKNES